MGSRIPQSINLHCCDQACCGRAISVDRLRQYQGIAGQRPASGYMVLLEVLARPTLMIFGLITATVILTPFMDFFASTFFNTLDTVTTDTLFGAVTFVFTLIIYGALCWMVVNMVMNAIIQVPNGIMRVIGGMEGTNMRMGQEMSGGVKSGVMIGMNKTMDAAQSARRAKAFNPGDGPGGGGEDKADPSRRNHDKPDKPVV